MLDKVKEAVSSASRFTELAVRLREAYMDERDSNRAGYMRVEGRVYILPATATVMIVGDIHGDLETLVEMLEGEKVLDRLGGKKDFYLVFLGDYVDRGPYQLETLALASMLKLSFPGKVVTLRGNHEPPPGLTPMPHDFPYMLYRVYGEAGKAVYSEWFRTFQELPYAAMVVNSALLIHGGLPTRNLETSPTLQEYLYAGNVAPPTWLLEEILWNDPAEDVDLWAPSPRGAGRLFGPRVMDAVEKRFGIKAVIRGHEPTPRGYKFNHGGRVLTLFSRMGAPYFNESAAYAVIEFNYKYWYEELETFIVTLSPAEEGEES